MIRSLGLLAPFASLLLMFAILLKRGIEWREAFLAAAVLGGVCVTAITEILSLFRVLSYPGILVSWSLVTLVLTVFYSKIERHATPRHREPLRFSGTWLAALLGVGWVISVLGFLASIAPPNNYDSMTYHMSRVMHWIQDGGVAHFPTSIRRQVYSNPWSEFAITHLQLLTGGDRLANLVQWFSMIGCVVGASLITKHLGGGTASQIFAALIVATLPMGILQASSTQNDWVAALWCIAFIQAVLMFRDATIDHRKALGVSLIAGSSVGLALLSKATSYLYTPPFLVWMAWRCWRRFGISAGTRLLVLAAGCVVLLNVGHWWRNYEVFHSPVSPPTTRTAVANGVHSPPFVLSNVVRNLALHLATPSVRANEMVMSVVDAIHHGLGVDPDDQRVTFPGSRFALSTHQWHEDYAGNLPHFLLLLFSLGIFVAAARYRRSGVLVVYLLCTVGAFLLFCFYLKWQPWSSRFHLPLFVMCAPFMAVCLEHPSIAPSRPVFAGLLLVAAQMWLFHNETRPLIGLDIRNVFETSRLDRYFVNMPHLQSQYVQAAKIVTDLGCREVGLWTAVDSCEYPLWWLLNPDDGRTVRIEHINVTNETSRLYAPERFGTFAPCAIISIDKNELKTQIQTGAVVHPRIWMEKDVAVYATQPTSAPSGSVLNQ